MIKKLSVGLLFIIVLLVVNTTCNAYLLQKKVFSGTGSSLAWTFHESAPDNAYTRAEDDMYVVHIDNKGQNESDIKVSYRGFSLYKGVTYNIAFKLTATKDCKFNAKIMEYTDPYTEVLNSYLTPYSIKANEVLSVNQKFTSPKDIANAELSFEFGGRLAGEVPYDVKIISVTLSGNNPATPTPAPLRDIRVNQLGYFPSGPKKATLNLQGQEISTPLTWKLINSTGEVVATGKTIPSGSDHSSGENVHIIDFTGYTAYGKDYQLVVGNAVSHKFDITQDLYSNMKYDSLKYFYHARSSIKIEMPYCVESQWARPAGHADDTASLKEGTDYTGPKTLNCTGGWYDSADHNKYLVNGGLSLWLLQNQYEHSKLRGTDAIFLEQLYIPESDNDINDLMDETRWEMEWMLKMQIPSGYDKEGMASHKVADENWTGLATRPDQDTQKRIYSPPSTAATLNLAACAAQAARIWKDVDSAFANKCLTAAVKAYNAAKENPAMFVKNGQETGSTAYGDNYLEDEFYWAACELYATTREQNYITDIKSYKNCFEIPVELSGEDQGIKGCFNCSSTGALGTITLALTCSNEFPQVIESIIKAADIFISEQKKESYGMPLPESTFKTSFFDIIEEYYGYPTDSNSYIVYKAVVLAYAYDFAHKNKYISSIMESMDYLIGRNVNNKSYITGYGDDPAKYPNHRFFCPNADPSFPPVPPGFLVSGPNSSGQDHLTLVYQMKELKFPAQKCYFDNEQSWSTNVVKINLNAGLAWAAYYIDSYCSEGLIYLNEDINKDFTINMADVAMIAKGFGLIKSDTNFDFRCDLNGDGSVNMSDVIKIVLKFGYSY